MLSLAPPPRETAATPPSARVSVMPARAGDAPAIARLLAQASGSCLPLDSEEIRARLPEFEVVRDSAGVPTACAALRREGARAELRCLVVAPARRGSGTGRALVERIAQRAARFGRDLFCVSRCPAWFEALGFVRLPPDFVPARPGATSGRHALVLRRETPPPYPRRGSQ